jgi:hypothetical protein
MPANAPKVLLRSEHSAGAVALTIDTENQQMAGAWLSASFGGMRP